MASLQTRNGTVNLRRLGVELGASPPPNGAEASTMPAPIASKRGEALPALTPTTVPSASEIIAASLEENARVEQTYSKHLSARTTGAIPNALRARSAFDGFHPTQFTQQERDPRRYLAPGEDLTTALARVVQDGVERVRANASRQGLRIDLTPEITSQLQDEGPGGQRRIFLPDFLKLIGMKLPTAPALRDEPALTACAAALEAQKQIDAIEGNVASAGQADTTPDLAAPDHQPAQTTDFIEAHVHALLADVPSPDVPPGLSPPVAADHGHIKQNIQSFELRSGASDVTAYHDFNALQIAFEHVWAEVVDARVGQVGRDFYHAYVDLIDFLGNPVDPTTGKPITPPPVVTSIDDIANLIQDASMLGRVAGNAVPPPALPPNFLTGYSYARQNLINGFHLYDPTDFPQEEDAGGFVDASMAPLRQQIDLANSQAAQNKALATTLPAVTRLQTLLEQMRDLLGSKYSFSVYQENTCNFGMITTYRQTWTPDQYQVGDLVSTIPLAPREVRRYTTKQVTKRSRALKEIANNLNTLRTDIDTTGRADGDIVSRAENRTNFKVTADGSFGVDADKIHATAEGGGDSAKISETTKKDFREAVLKSAHEYKQENRTEVETTTSEETETTSYNEIQNPNDELTVTYLFYELQRTYHIAERIQQVTPVVLVANRVPAPHEIDDAWLIRNDWILRRVLLDDSFRGAIDYLTKSFVGDELTLQVLQNNVEAQRQVVDTVKAQVAAQLVVVDAAQRDLSTKMDVKGGMQVAEGFLETVKGVFDPLHLTGQSATGTNEGVDAIAAYAQETLDRAEREKARLLDQLGMATTALQAAVDKVAAAMKEHYDKVAEIDRLRLHVKENIIYYMQAIWNHEPPDQRYFRVFEVQVPVPVPVKNSTNMSVPLTSPPNALPDTLRQRDSAHVAIPMPDVEIEWKPLVEIADLDNVLGYKGNYAIYRLNENNCLTLHMMQDYLQLSDELTIRDPDDFANYTIDELQQLATCLYQSQRDVYDKHKEEIKQWMIDRLTSGRPEDDRVIVPTKSHYIEALVGTHPLLEDFKLLHRALDVRKVQGEVRHAELENVRLAARALKGNDEDPDIEKKIVIATDTKDILVAPGQ
jgi:hypothetical protein